MSTDLLTFLFLSHEDISNQRFLISEFEDFTQFFSRAGSLTTVAFKVTFGTIHPLHDN